MTTRTLDLSFQEVIYSPVCLLCAHISDPVEKKCKAFPDGIPAEIWNGNNGHRKPYAGDHGIQFAPNKPPVKGGPGSGFHGHAGRPGEVGGSAPAGTAPGAPAESGAPVDELRQGMPTLAQLDAGEWKKLPITSSAKNIWRVTTADGRKWFVKQPMADYAYEKNPNALGAVDEAWSESAAFNLANALGLDCVPVQAVTDLGPLAHRFSEKGAPVAMVQPWIDDAKDMMNFADGVNADRSDDLFKVHVFDYLIRNTDRHEGNLMMKADGSLLLIDHGNAFGNKWSVSYLFEWRTADMPITQKTLSWAEAGIAKAEKRALPQERDQIRMASERLTMLKDMVELYTAPAKPPPTWREIWKQLEVLDFLRRDLSQKSTENDWSVFSKGGPGSGFHGHVGRPGEVGGSAAAGTAPVAPVAPATSAAPVSFPTEQELLAGEWSEIGAFSSAAGKWIVTTKDGKKWFVKQPSKMFDKEHYDEIDSELAADVLGREMGFPMVPVGFYPAKPGSALSGRLSHEGQSGVLAYPWLDGSIAYGDTGMAKFDTSRFTEKLKVEFSLFDFLIKNADRHPGNLMFDKGGNPLLIDNGISFNVADNFPAKPFFWHDSRSGDLPVTDELLGRLKTGIQNALKSPIVESRIGVERKVFFALRRFGALQRAIERVKTGYDAVTWNNLKEELDYARA